MIFSMPHEYPYDRRNTRDEPMEFPEELWRDIPEFSSYTVSSEGNVRNIVTERILRVNRTRAGVAMVALWRDNHQYNRSLSLLVARAFVPPHPSSGFDTPIHRDGDRGNNHVSNLTWRPRWFAYQYTNQFVGIRPMIEEPIMDSETGVVYSGSWSAALHHGLLNNHVLLGVLNKTPVWPTEQIFCFAR